MSAVGLCIHLLLSEAYSSSLFIVPFPLARIIFHAGSSLDERGSVWCINFCSRLFYRNLQRNIPSFILSFYSAFTSAAYKFPRNLIGIDTPKKAEPFLHLWVKRVVKEHCVVFGVTDCYSASPP